MNWLNWISNATGDSTSKSAEAGHDFRDDSGARDGKDNFNSSPSWAPTETEGGVPMIPAGTEIESPSGSEK
jgi:hypothetical protein